MHKTPTYSAQEVFEAFLYMENSRGRHEWKMYDERIHTAFHEVSEYSADLQEYEFTKLKPHTSSTLLKMFSDYRKSGILVAEKEFLMLRNTEPLEEPCDELIDTTGEICDLL